MHKNDEITELTRICGANLKAIIYENNFYQIIFLIDDEKFNASKSYFPFCF